MAEAAGKSPLTLRSTATDPLPPDYNAEAVEDFGEAILRVSRQESFCMLPYDLAELNPKWLPPWETQACDSALVKAIAAGWLPAERSRALEIGCGYGYSALHLGAQGFARVVGVDLSLPAINRARKLAQARGLADRVRFACYDGYDLPAPAEPFPFVYDNTLFNNTEVHTQRTIPEYMAMLRRVVAPGATFILVFARNDNNDGPFSTRVSGLPTPSLEHIRTSFGPHMHIRAIELDAIEYDIVDISNPGQRVSIGHPGGYAVMTPTW